MTSQKTLEEILKRLTAIERNLASIANPVAQIGIDEQGEMMRKAIEMGDKKRIKALTKAINGRNLQ